jgi:hypothetical protein
MAASIGEIESAAVGTAFVVAAESWRRGIKVDEIRVVVVVPDDEDKVALAKMDGILETAAAI